MRLLLDTHILLWAVSAPDRIPADVLQLLNDRNNEPHFSVVNIWEIAIKTGLGRPSFRVDPGLIRQTLLDNDYRELSIAGAHALAIGDLPAIHKDPFDRMLIAQAAVEDMELFTADATIARYPGRIRLI